MPGVTTPSSAISIASCLGHPGRVSLVALAAVGLSLIYGVTSIVNFAHSEMVAFGAVVTWTLEDCHRDAAHRRPA